MNTQHIDKRAGVPCEAYTQSSGKQIKIGDGFSAQSYRHSEFDGLMDPLIMVDHFVMTKPTFGTHAHAGLSAVTVMFEDSEGGFRNRDSLGNDIDLAPGDLYWFKAAKGAIHSEEPRPGNGIAGAVAPDNPLTLLDIDLQAGGQFTQLSENGQHAWILAIKGAATVSWNAASADLQTGTAIAVSGTANISISSELGAHVVLFQGNPLRQEFVQRGPFSMGNTAELDAIEADYRSGRLGSID